MRLILFLLVPTAIANAQQPFLTDDTDTAPAHHFHLELFSERDRLQDTARPNLNQNTTRIQLTYGLLENLEIGFDVPLISIYRDRQSGIPDAFGFGDLDLQMKYRLREDRDGSKLPAITLGLFIEVPTGNPNNQLGSGLADYWLNVITQKNLSPRLTYRLNSGILFSGNTLTGAIGIPSTRGSIFTGSSSLTYQLTGRWLIGGEIAGALTKNFDLGKGQLQGLFGVKYALTKSIGLDLALTGGKYEGSPRVGAAGGISIDF